MRRRAWSLARFCLAAGALVAFFFCLTSGHCQETHIMVDAGRVINHVTPWMYGSCIEDVNHEIYGGLYDQKIFGESFEEPPPAADFQGWTTYGGSWRADGPTVHVAADAGAKLVRDAPDFADGTVDAEVQFSDRLGQNAGLLVRVQNPGTGPDNFDGYEISLSPSSRQLILGKHRHDWQPLVTVPAAAEPGQRHHLRVTLEGPRLRVYLDDRPAPQIDFTDINRPLLSGKVALRTWNSDASFQGVQIETGHAVFANSFRATTGPSVSGQWDALAVGGAAEFLYDSQHAVNGTHCQKIVHGPGTGLAGVSNRGLNRWGIAVKQGQTFEGRIYLRAAGLRGPVTVALQSADGRQTYAARKINGIHADWSKYSFRLTSKRTDHAARFALWIDRPGILWADQAVLLGTGAEQFHGLPIRADIARRIVQEGVTFLRYGGTMVNVPGYRWKDMIGDPDRRPPYQGNWYPYATNGFGIEDFLKFCEAARIEPAFALNIEETPQDAADLVDYLNGPVTTAWGRRRAENGHPRPYGVRYIEIGNEEVIGADDPAAYAHYVARFGALYAAMHPHDPGLRLVCAAWWRPDSANVKAVFQALSGRAACWDLHVWADEARAGADVDRQLTQMQSRFQSWVPGTPMKAVIFEENGGRHDMQRALGHATILNATRRRGDFVLADCPANGLQPWRQNDNGWDQGQIFFTPDHAWAMPPYYAQQMAAQNSLPLRVQSSVSGGKDLDVTATRSEDGRTLVLSVVQTGSEPEPASLSLSGFAGCKPVAAIWTLSGEPQATNPPDGPETVRPRKSVLPIAGSAFDYTFPAHSYTVLRLTR